MRRVCPQTSRNLGVQNYLLRCSGSVFFGPRGHLFERIQYSISEDFARKSGSKACPETRKIFSHGSPVSRRQHPVGAVYQLPRALYRGRYLSGSPQPHPSSRRRLLGMRVTLTPLESPPVPALWTHKIPGCWVEGNSCVPFPVSSFLLGDGAPVDWSPHGSTSTPHGES